MCRIKLRSKCSKKRKGQLLQLMAVYPALPPGVLLAGMLSNEAARTGDGVMAIIIHRLVLVASQIIKFL